MLNSSSDMVSPPGAAGSAIDDFLSSFAALARQFRQTCEGYLQGRVDLGEITRSLSAATADAEHSFSLYSAGMSMEQLQRFASLQRAFDCLMEQIFREEIRRNRQTMAKAIENGEYFLVNLTRKSIESAIYMLHSKDRIKTAQAQKLAELDQQHEQVLAMLKVIRALEQACTSLVDLGGLQRVEKILGLYLEHFQACERNGVLSACDRRLLGLIKTHCEGLLGASTGPITAEHIRRCIRVLGRLPSPEALEPMLSACRSLNEALPYNRQASAA